MGVRWRRVPVAGGAGAGRRRAAAGGPWIDDEKTKDLTGGKGEDGESLEEPKQFTRPRARREGTVKRKEGRKEEMTAYPGSAAAAALSLSLSPWVDDAVFKGRERRLQRSD